MSRYDSDCKVYVGDLGSNVSKQEIEDAFQYYGPLRNVWVARNPPGFAFVEFEDRKDAEDAVRGLDGRSICGRRARVEVSNARSGNNRGRGPPPRSRGRSFHPDDKCYECGDRGHYARDCRDRKSRRGRSRSRSVSRSRNRRSRSRSNSKSRSRSRSRRSRSASKKSRSGSGSNTKEEKRTRSCSHSRSRSALKENGNGNSNERE